MWDTTSGKALFTLTDHTDRVQAVATTSSSLLVSGGVDKTVRVWDLDSGQCVRVFEGHRGAICGLAFTDDSRLAISASADDTLRVWDVEARSLSYKLPSHQNTVTSLKTDPLDRFVVSSSLDGTIQTYSLADHFQSVTKLGVHGRSIECVTLSNDGRLLLSASSDHNLKLWDVEKGTELRTYCKHADWVNAVVFTDDNLHCVSGSDDRTVVVWEVATGRAIRSLIGHEAAVKSVSCLHTETRHLIVSGSCDRTIRVWDLQNGNRVHILSGHSKDVRCVATALFPAYGPVAVSASRDKTAKLWSLDTAVCLKTFYGHQLPVNSVVLLKDGLHILTASSDKTIRLWSIDSGASLASFYAESGVTCLSLAADERTIVFGTNNGWISKAWLRLAGCIDPLPSPNVQQYIEATKQRQASRNASPVLSEAQNSEKPSRSDTIALPLTLESETPLQAEAASDPPQTEGVISSRQSNVQGSEQFDSDKRTTASEEINNDSEVAPIAPRIKSQHSQPSSSCVLL